MCVCARESVGEKFLYTEREERERERERERDEATEERRLLKDDLHQTSFTYSILYYFVNFVTLKI